MKEETYETCSPEWFEQMQMPSDVEKIYPVEVNEYETLMLPKMLVYQVHLFAGPFAKDLIIDTYQDICTKDPLIICDEGKLTKAVCDRLRKNLSEHGGS